MNSNKDSREKLIKTLGGYDGNTGPSEAAKAEILANCVEDLINSIDKNSEKSSQLSRVIIWLNVILAIATLALAIIAGTDLYLRIQDVDSFHQTTQISTDVSK